MNLSDAAAESLSKRVIFKIKRGQRDEDGNILYGAGEGELWLTNHNIPASAAEILRDTAVFTPPPRLSLNSSLQQSGQLQQAWAPPPKYGGIP